MKINNIFMMLSAAAATTSALMIGSGYILNKFEDSGTEYSEKKALENENTSIFSKAWYKTKQVIRDSCRLSDTGEYVLILGLAGLAGLSITTEYSKIQELSKLPENELLKKLDELM